MPRRVLKLMDPADELIHGESVIIAARWVLVVAGLLLALWNPGGLVQLQVAIVVILAVAIGNFALHMHVVTRGKLLARIVYAASVADLAAISLLIVSGGGVPSAPFVFYLPALLAISVTFRTELTGLYTLGAVCTYGAIAIVTAHPDALLPVLIQILMMAAVPICGNVYWRLERDRRRQITAAGRPDAAARETDSMPVPAPATR